MQRPRCSAKCPYTCRLIVAPGRSRSITAVVVVVIVFPSIACSVIAGLGEELARARPASALRATAGGATHHETDGRDDVLGRACPARHLPAQQTHRGLGDTFMVRVNGGEAGRDEARHVEVVEPGELDIDG